MSDDDTLAPDELGTLERAGDRWIARIERHIDHPVDAVWSMLTTPSEFAKWLAPGSIELRKGGAARLDFEDSGIVIDSTVTAFEAGRLIEYGWNGRDEPERPLRFELTPDGTGTRLQLTLSIPADEDIAKSCAGFESHLLMLIAALEGVPIKFPFERYVAARKAYSELAAARG